MFRFDGEVALVTGASRGIGRAVARVLAAQGARIAVHFAHDRAAAEATLTAIGGAAAGHAAFQARIDDPDAAPALVRDVAARMGRLDVLVNNAGIYEEHDIATIRYDAWRDVWRRTLDLNLVGPANLIFTAVEVMRAAGGGRIVNVSSRGAFRGEPIAPAYGASKAGLNALGQSMARALAPLGIFVGTVAPGYVETDMTAETLSGPAGDGIRAQSPLHRVATPDDVAHAVAFLASREAAFATGSIIDVNGASYLRT